MSQAVNTYLTSLQVILNMPLRGCYSSRSGPGWGGFANDRMTSYRVSGGCCRFYEQKDCINKMFSSCGESPNVGNFINDKLSSVYCWAWEVSTPVETGRAIKLGGHRSFYFQNAVCISEKPILHNNGGHRNLCGHGHLMEFTDMLLIMCAGKRREFT